MKNAISSIMIYSRQPLIITIRREATLRQQASVCTSRIREKNGQNVFFRLIHTKLTPPLNLSFKYLPSLTPSEVCTNCHPSRLAYPFFKFYPGNFSKSQDLSNNFTRKTLYCCCNHVLTVSGSVSVQLITEGSLIYSLMIVLSPVQSNYNCQLSLL